jgi:hypothetical protein
MAGDDDDRHGRRFATELSGFHEVHFNAGAFPTANSAGTLPSLRGAIFTPASGKFRAKLDHDRNEISYELEYKNLVGDVTQAHIHFGQNHTVGGIVVWLCQTANTPAPSEVAGLTPVCPASGKVSGTIQAVQVLAQSAQGFPPNDLGALISALRAGAAYANVHSTTFGPGEIRGQIESNHHRH